MAKTKDGFRAGATGVEISSSPRMSGQRTSTVTLCPRCTGTILGRLGERVCLACGHDLDWETEKVKAEAYRDSGGGNWVMWS